MRKDRQPTLTMAMMAIVSPDFHRLVRGSRDVMGVSTAWCSPFCDRLLLDLLPNSLHEPRFYSCWDTKVNGNKK